ncbi:MAG: DUF4956 domain-containing protein [Muribaculaceae bacterium]|nr:DUF4956 domain-containing protein [Muribaculaceae bacterium]
MEDIQIFNVPLLNLTGTAQLVFRFLFNAFFVWIIIHIFYYRKNLKMNYYFTFSLISVSVFFLTYMLGGVKIKVGMALGLFAIFGIIRYRTEVISVREMTYLFVIITLSVINAMAVKLSYSELCTANILFVIAVWLFEGSHKLKQVSCKYILYDRLDHIKPDQHAELLKEVEERTGLKIINIEVGAINYLQDTVMLKVFYELPKGEVNSVDTQMKLPRNEE